MSLPRKEVASKSSHKPAIQQKYASTNKTLAVNKNFNNILGNQHAGPKKQTLERKFSSTSNYGGKKYYDVLKFE